MKTLVICTAMSAMILCACGGKNTQSTEETAKVVPMAVITPAINQLTDQEKAEGWALLFDGKTTKGWRGAHKDAFPDHGWMVRRTVRAGRRPCPRVPVRPAAARPCSAAF